MQIFSIETSCDETAVAVVSFNDKNGSVSYNIEGEEMYSQVDLHNKYGGVVPHLAKREHQKILPILSKKLLEKLLLLENAKNNFADFAEIAEHNEELLNNTKKLFSDKKIKDISYIAVTHGPGLSPALWVGINFAKILSNLYNIPIIPINHMEGHICAALIKDNKYIIPKYPLLALLVSGGHTELVLSDSSMNYKCIGETLDDACGEAFDKVARLLSLPYPGGPEISKLAKYARKNNLISPVNLPRPMIKDATFNFSYSGLKTAVKVYLENNKLNSNQKAALCMEFENAVVETLISKTLKAIEEFNPKTVVIAGGVSANSMLRETIKKEIEKYVEISLFIPNIKYSTDNAVMIALSGYINRNKKFDQNNIFAVPKLKL